MAPKIAIRIAPPHTRMVPPRDHLVKGSPRIKVAQIELNTKPDCLHQYLLQFRVKTERTA